MKHFNLGLLILVPLILLSTAQYYKNTKTSKNSVKNEPAMLAAIPGTDLQQITLTAKAAERLGIETVLIQEEKVASSSGSNSSPSPMARKTVPYSSVIYDLQGRTWLYMNTKPLIYVRTPIIIDHIEARTVYLSEGPLTGTKVVTVGVPELYGIETGIGK